MAIDILDQHTVSKIISDIESDQNRARREKEFKAWSVMNGKTRQYVEARLREQFPEDWKVMEVADIAVSNKVVKKLAKAYKSGVIREVTDDPSGAKTDVMEEIYSEGMFDRSFMAYDELFNLHKWSVLWVVKREDEPLKVQPLPASSVNVIRNQDSGKLECVILNFPDTTITRTTSNDRDNSDGVEQLIAESGPADSSAQSRVYAMWTDENHAVVKVTQKKFKEGLKTSVDYVNMPDNPNMVNPLGKIPFVFLSQEMGPELPILSPLTSQSITYNVLLSHALTSASRQGFAQLVVSAPAGTKLERLHQGFSTGMFLPQPADGIGSVTADFINPSPDLAGQLSTYLAYLQQTLSTYGITGDSIAGNNVSEFSSGLERLIANADVSNKIEENQMFYMDVEQQVFDIVKRYLALDGRSPFSDEDKLMVKYKKPRVTISDTETLANLEKKMDLGLITKAEALMVLDPNLSLEDAENKIMEIEGEKLGKAMKVLEGMKEDAKESPDKEASPAVESDAEERKRVALNGAQVSAILTIVKDVAAGNLPRNAALNLIQTSFNLSKDEAESVLGEAGKSFKIAKEDA